MDRSTDSTSDSDPPSRSLRGPKGNAGLRAVPPQPDRRNDAGSAGEVPSTQARLRGLLRANQTISVDLGLPEVLRRIVSAARELVGARYAALGVIAADGLLAEFVHVGMDSGTVERIGQLPQGKGLLGALIADPRPIRRGSIAQDPRSSGFPPGHPPMTSFLGVPIRVRGVVFGNLYLTESVHGAFNSEDEELVNALAATAGVAIDNARLYEASKTRQRWLQATAAISGQLLSTDPGRPLEFIAESSRAIAGADVVTVLLPAPSNPEELRVEVAVGAGDLLGLRVAIAGSLSGHVFTTGKPLRCDRASDEPRLMVVAGGALNIGPVLVLPLRGSQRAVQGVLTLARLSGRAAFTADDLEMAAGFANQASIAIELADARAEQQKAVMFADRERIAADLHDHVIQSMFAAGLTLQAVATRLDPGPMTDRILGAITTLDETIRRIRTSIFQLQQDAGGTSVGARGRLLDAISDITPTLGFEPSLLITGPTLDGLSEDIASDLVAVLHEGLSNIARHAAAGAVEVVVTMGSDRVAVDIRDDGLGMGATTRRSGLANLRRRAERHAGSLTITGRPPAGTHLCWEARIG